jgi:TolB protein
MRIVFVLTMLAVAACLASAATTAQGTPAGANGDIAYSRFPSIWVVNQDGSNPRKLPHIPRSTDDNPDWAPNGMTIAFDRCAVKCEIWTIRSDGTGARRIGPNCLRSTGACVDRALPAWSPDGRRIAYSDSSGTVRADGRPEFSEIAIMNAGGSGARRITHLTEGSPYAMDIKNPAWSPDGKTIVFEVEHLASADPPNRHALFIVGADGSGLRQLTDWGLNAGDGPDWSPDGKRILFRTVSASNHDRGNLYTVSPDGSGLKRLTNYPNKTVGTGSFSPDGRWIVFARFSDTPYPALYAIHTNGTGLRRITSDDQDYEPDWGGRPR